MDAIIAALLIGLVVKMSDAMFWPRGALQILIIFTVRQIPLAISPIWPFVFLAKDLNWATFILSLLCISM